jgi:high-affinity iron transporter
MTSLFRRLALMFALFAALPAAALAQQGPAPAQQAAVQTTWRLLDYVAVDYPGAVRDGRVISDVEYGEMTEFSSTIAERIAALPAHERKPDLVRQAAALRAAVLAKAPPPRVAELARALAGELISAYPVPLAPRAAPDLGRAAALYRDNCASCHGAAGDGRGPMAANMEPAPIDFTDRARASERSLFALYQVIEQGLEDTPMASFAHLPVEDRWALAHHVGQFAYPPALAAEGERIWRADAALRTRIGNLEALAAITPAALAAQVGPERAAALTAYLRANPSAVTAAAGGPLDIARARLADSLAAYRAGDHDGARELALAAYLSGFEPVEPILATRNGGLLHRVEVAMAQLRSAIADGRPVDEVESRIEALKALFAETESVIAPGEASSLSTFLGGFLILAREGLEALLIVIAMIVFLQRADRRSELPYVHGGWILALIAGAATWWAATHIVTISGASREITEGAGSLFAAIVLVLVGIWMHGKAQANEWQRYIQATLGKALGRGSAWFLFLLAFVVVYREVFETILFYAALSAQGDDLALLAGAATAAALLAAIAWAMLKYSRRLPITQFFLWSSVLIAVLAVVLTGKGVAALQEGGFFGITPLPRAPSIRMLGIAPTLEAIGSQIAVLLILIVGFARNRRRSEPVPAE